MSNTSFNDLQPRLAALTEGVSGSALRTQQAVVTFLFSASQAQFGFSRGLAEDVTEAFKANPTTNPAAAIRTLVSRWHDRSEQAIGEFRRLSDDLRGSFYESVAQPLTKASEVVSEATEKGGETVKSAVPAAPLARVRSQA